MTKNINEQFLNLPHNVIGSIERKIREFYELEKQNSIIIMPLFSFILMSGGNHFQLPITCRENFCLSAIQNDFKASYIMPGYYFNIDDIDEDIFKNVLDITSLYYNISNRTMSPETTAEREYVLLSQKIEKFKEKLEDSNYNLFEKCNIVHSIGFDETLEKVREILQIYDEKTTPIVIFARDDVYRVNYTAYGTYKENDTLTRNNFKKLEELEKEFNAKIFLASNNGGRDSHCDGMSLRFYEDIYVNKYPIVKDIDDFFTKYTTMILEKFKEELNFEKLIEDIYSGYYGSTNEEIAENIDNINLSELTGKPYVKKYNSID